MAFNPFSEKPIKFHQQVSDWDGLYPNSYDKLDTDAYTKLRIILMNGTEFEATWFLHHFNRHCNNNDLRRELAEIRRIEQQQQKRVSCLKPINETILEHTIGYEQLAVDLTANLALNEPDEYVKQALDFALLEDFDHLYRYANLLDTDTGIHADMLVNQYAEIMPGRPTIAEHRFPSDDIKGFINSKTAAAATKLNVGIITAAEQQTMNYYMNIATFYPNDIGRRLYQEIGMIEEQHVSHYGSLIDPNSTLLECLLMHEYTECFLYYSCYTTESCPKIKEIWEQHLMQEIAHLHVAKDLLKKYEHKEWQQVIPEGCFPYTLNLKPQKEYVRTVLANTVELTANKEGYSDNRTLPPDNNFTFYQNLVNVKTECEPSHIVTQDHIDRFGEDYRFEMTKNPIPSLTDRTKDNITLGREIAVKGKATK